jgi:hypothetical protein
MDELEDSWWPNSVPESRPFTLPPSSQWLQQQVGTSLIIRAGGDEIEYHTGADCLPFLMLLDMVQLTYLGMSNSGKVIQQESFYKGVIFLDSLRGDFLATVRKIPLNCDGHRALFPDSMRRWLCRLLSAIPHDPQNRKQHAQILNKAYLEMDVFNHGVPSIQVQLKLI